MQSVHQIAKEIVAREGGYVDDPDDPGGATKYGVTLGTLKWLGLDLTGDGKVDKADIRALTRPRAEAIFVKHYFERPGVSRLPRALHATVFDMYVNAGSQAVRILQRLLREMGFEIAVDGAIGPETLQAAQVADNVNSAAFVNAYGIARRNYYYRLADQRPQSRKFARRRDGGKGGWIKRAEEFIAAKYHLTDQEHAARVAHWS